MVMISLDIRVGLELPSQNQLIRTRLASRKPANRIGKCHARRLRLPRPTKYTIMSDQPPSGNKTWGNMEAKRVEKENDLEF